MIRQRAFAVACAATATTVLGLTAAPSQAISLGDISANGGSITVGDKLFSDFSCEVKTAIGFTIPVAAGSCQGLSVDGIQNNDNIVLQFGGLFQAGPDGISALDVLIGYTVTVVDPNQVLQAIDLAFNGKIAGAPINPPNFPSAAVVETVFDPSTNEIIGELGVSTPIDKQDPPLEILLGDLQLTKPVRTARVLKDISLTAPAGGSFANISFIDQSFHQTSTPVPEPSAMGGLLAFGSLGIGAMLKRQQQQSNKLALSATSNESGS